MGKSTKRKAPGVGIDFKRAKHKVGKALPRAQNDTSVAFRSKAITLPGQSVNADRSGAAVSSHNLTLKELLGQVGHYSERMRIGALSGLADLLTRHPEQASRASGPLLEALAPRVGDSDAAVRKALLSLLTDQVLPGVGPMGLRPFLPLLMAHISSAMTSLSDGVRADALTFLEALMDVVPAAVASGFLQPALLHFCDLLSSNARGASIKSRSLGTLHKVAAGLLSFLSKAAQAADAAAPAHSGTQQPGTSLREREGAPLAWRRAAWPSAKVAAARAEALAGLGKPGGIVTTSQQSTGSAAAGHDDSPAAVAARLGGRLLEAWSDCGPAALAAAPELPPSQCMAALLACLNLLLPYFESTPGEQLAVQAGVLKRIAPHFPARAPAVPPPAPLRAALVFLNLSAARLLSRVLPEAPQGPLGFAAPGQQEAAWVQRLVAFYVGVLRDGSALPSEDAAKQPKDGSKAAAAPAEAVAAVLDGISLALPRVSGDSRAALLSAVTSLADRSPSRSAARAACLALQARLLAAFTLRTHAGPEDSWAFVSEEEAAHWLQGIPKLLWELGDSAPATSEAALRLLLDAGRTATPGGALAAALSGLQPQLAPLLGALLPLRRGGASAAPRFTAGPLARLPARCQTLAVDLLACHERLDEASLRAVGMLALSGAFPPALGARAVGVAAAVAAAGAAPPAPWHSLLAALLLGGMTGVPAEDDWTRHEVIVGAACVTLRACGGPGHSWALLEPLLLAQWRASPRPQRALYGILRAAAGVLTSSPPVTAAQPTAAGSVPAQPAAAALLGGPDGAPAGAALPSEDGGGGGAGLSEAARAALPAMIRQYAQACAAEAEADSNAGGGGDGAAGGMAAADAAVPADAPPGLRPVLELLRLGASLLPAVLAALGEPAAKSGDGPALAAAAGALAAAAAVLAAPQLRGAVLEVEADVQRLLDSVGQVVGTAGAGTVAGERCRQQHRELQSAADALYGRLHGA